MENEKRKVGDYTVLCAVNIGSREIILAENEQSTNGERFLCCYGERNDIFEKFTECAVGGDYIDATLFFAERIKQDAEKFRAEVEKLDIPVTVITQADCIPDHYKNDINGKIIAINPAILKPEYQRADRQLYYVTGGFGASANSRGSAVFCKNLYDGKNTRYERMDVLGEVKPECMPDWAEKKAILFRHTQSSKLMFEYGGRMFSPYRLFTKAENTLDFISLHTARDFELGFMSKDCPESKTSYNPQEVATMDESKKQILSDIFWEMNSISSRSESHSETEISETDDGNGNIVQTETTVTKTTLYITVSHLTVDEMADLYGFDAEQREYLAELLKDENNSIWAAVLYGIRYSDDQIVTVALSQVGNVGGEPYWSWYGFGSRVEWCACFVSWCADQCGYIDTGVVPKYAGCVNGVQWFKDRGQWIDGSAEPVPGMIIFFDWDNKGSSGPQDGQSDHTGIVQKVENGIVYTVEGNSGDSCRVNQYSVGHYEILGYGVPQY